MKHIVCFFLTLVASWSVISQTGDMSLTELKDYYFKQRAGFSSSSGKKFSSEQQAELDNTLSQIKELDPSSFEYNLISWVNGNYNMGLEKQLFTAYSLNSSDETTVREMFAYYILTSNAAKQKEFLLKVQKYYTPAEIAYYGDAMPLSKSILLTSNQEDMYGFLVAQSTLNAGADVQILNLDFMKSESYRELVSNNTGITDQVFLGNEKAYLKSMLANSSGKIYISSTVPQDYFSLISDKIYLTGLSYQYGNIDQFTELSAFWKKVKTKDISALTLSRSSETKLYGNYLPPLITLYMMQPNDQILKSSIQAIAVKVGKESEVNEILKEIEAN